MAETPDASAAREQRLNVALADCLEALEKGATGDVSALVRRHPEFAAELADLLAARAHLARLTTRLVPDPSVTTRAPDDAASTPDGAGAVGWDGTPFGDYRLCGEIGRGGMATVYRALQVGLNRWVALKLIDLPSTAAVHRFRAEAEIVAMLDHPQIVPIYEIGDHQGRPYFTMKLMARSLADVIATRETPFPPREAALLVARVARAVHHAHQHGVLHRDIKPGNILLDGNGDPHVADFGLARRAEAGLNLTQSGAIVGTPAYMAPEQAGGGKQSQTTADVYGLGAVLYELITGRRPFRGETVMDTVLQVIERPPVRPRALCPKLPVDLETICLKCLEKKPDGRYASAALLAEDLESFLAGEPVRARPVTRLERIGRWCMRSPLVAGLLASLVLAVLVGVAGISWKWLEAEARRREAEASRRAADDNARAERAARLRADTLLVELGREHLRQALTHLDQGKTTLGMLELGRALQIAPDSAGDLRRFIGGSLSAWRHRLPPPLTAVLKSQRGRVPAADAAAADRAVRAAVFSPDARLVIAGGDDGLVRVWDLAAGQPTLPPFEHDGSVRCVARSRDGRTVLTGGFFKTPRLWDVASGKLLQQFAGHGDEAWAVAIRPDGGAVLTGGADRTARLWDARTGLPLGAPLEHPDWVWAVAFSPDGQTAVTACKDHVARLWDLRTGKPVGSQLPHPRDVTSVSFSPDGGRVLTGCIDGGARVWDAAAGTQLGATMRQAGRLSSVAFGPDGKQVLTCGQEGTVRVWDLATGGSVSVVLPPEQRELGTAAFSADGKRFLTAGFDGAIRVRETPQQPARDVLECGHWVTAVTFRPDGRTLLVGSADLPFPLGPGPLPDGKGQARLWDVATRAPRGEWLDHAYTVLKSSVSPDGSCFITGSGVFLGAAGEFRLWDGASGRPRGEAVRLNATVYAVTFAPDGRTFVVGTGQGEGGLAQRALSLIGRNGMAEAGLESRLGYASGPGQATIYDTATGKPVGEPIRQAAWVTAAAYSPDGKTLLTGGADGVARRWDVASRQLIPPTISVGDSVIGVTYSHDGRMIATGSGNGVTKLWDARTGESLGKAFAQKGWVRPVAFSPDDAIVLSGGADKVARLWDVRTGEPLGPPLEHQEAVTAAVFSPDGRTIATGSTDRTVRLWPTPVRAEVEAERAILWLQLRTGMELDHEGVLRALDAAQWWERHRLLQQAGGPPDF